MILAIPFALSLALRMRIYYLNSEMYEFYTIQNFVYLSKLKLGPRRCSPVPVDWEYIHMWEAGWLEYVVVGVDVLVVLDILQCEPRNDCSIHTHHDIEDGVAHLR